MKYSIISRLLCESELPCSGVGLLSALTVAVGGYCDTDRLWDGPHSSTSSLIAIP